MYLEVNHFLRGLRLTKKKKIDLRAPRVVGHGHELLLWEGSVADAEVLPGCRPLRRYLREGIGVWGSKFGFGVWDLGFGV